MSVNKGTQRAPRSLDDQGVALIAVLIFALVASLTGLAFFSMTSYEFKGARDRQESSEAFYLADGGIDRARGELLEDNQWRASIPTTVLGSGNYNLTVQDTVMAGEDRVFLHAEGYVGEAARGVEVVGDVLSVIEALALFASRNIDANGNLNVGGHIHINGDGDFGPGDSHLKSGTYDEGYGIDPPAVYTEPGNFPNSTVYRVIGYPVPPNKAKALIDKWDRVNDQWEPVLTDSIPQSIVAFVVPDAQYPDGHYEFDFKKTGGNSAIENYFDYSTGVFRPDPGDNGVVVDFGWPQPGTQTVANIALNNSNTDITLRATIINTRFMGISEADRIEPCSGYWVGGNTTFGSKVQFAPENCVALIATQLGPKVGQQPNAQGKLGTVDKPGLTYVTGNVEGLKGALEVHGALISLCDINSQGGPDIIHYPDLEDCIPAGVLSEGGAGFLKFLEWREVPL